MTNEEFLAALSDMLDFDLKSIIDSLDNIESTMEKRIIPLLQSIEKA